MSYYENNNNNNTNNNSRPWPAAVGQQSGGWPDLNLEGPPVRSGASSTAPPQDPAAFSYQIEEVDRAIDNLVKSGKMFLMPGRHGRMGSNPGSRPHSVADYGDPRGGHQSNLQNFYASQRHQSSRGSNEAEQMMQAKRRMAAQRERELRNYHQEQQFNRTVLAELSYGGKPDRTLSPGSMSESERRELIARQRSALYGEGPFAETGGYVDETGTARPGVPNPHGPAPSSLRGHSPLAYEYGRTPPAEGGPQGPMEGGPGSQSAGPNQRSRANSTSSPQSNPAGSKGVFDAPGAQQQATRTSTSSPGESPGSKSGPGGNAVAPIGTRPSISGASGASAANAALNKRSTTPLPSPLSHGYGAPGSKDSSGAATGGGSGSSSAAPEGGMWGGRSGVWGNGKGNLKPQASVWG